MMPAWPACLVFFVLISGCISDQGSAPAAVEDEELQDSPPNQVVSINSTGDAVVRFAVTSDAACRIIAAGLFTVSRDRANMATISERDGASVWYSNVGVSVHAAEYAVWEGQFVGSYGQQATIESGVAHGTRYYTVAVHNMTWFPNEFTGPHSFVVDVECDGGFTVHDVTGSREAVIVDAWSLAGGVGFQAQLNQLVAGSGHVQDAWSVAMRGDDVRVLVVPMAEVLVMTWMTPTQEYDWRTGLSGGMIVLDGPAGEYGVRVDAGIDRVGDGFLAVIADLPMIPDGPRLD